MGAIDRRKHDIDVMERILGDVREEADAFDPPTDVVNIRVRPWFAGASTSVVHVTVSRPQPSPDRPHGKTDQEESDPYESDRRGEHRYPDSDEHDASRPSRREREALKERLERPS